jgi:ATP-dependent RNA helicase SUPV3L1/SUV3
LWGVCQIPDFRHILFEVHLELLRELFVALSEGPLSNEFLAARTQEFTREEGHVEEIVARIARLRTWAFVVNRAGFCRHAQYWSAHLSTLEDRLSDALHTGLVSTFVERRSKGQRKAQSQARKPESEPERVPSSIDRHHPFAALLELRARVGGATPSQRDPETTLERLVDAAHEAFELDAHGRIRAQGVELARLVRGAHVAAPNVELAPLLGVPAGVRIRLQRRVLAFARDSVGRHLGALQPLRHAEQPALRAIAYQLERGLGTANARDLSGPLALLSPTEREILHGAGVVAGHLTVHLPSTLRPAALVLRSTLLSAFDRDLALPPLGKTNYEVRQVSPSAWGGLGYIDLGPRACRVDLAERAARALAEGSSEVEALRCLSIPRRDAARVAEAIRGYLTARAGAA